MIELVLIPIGYIVGCFQSAFIISKRVGKKDIREHGSGNAGATNVLRVMGAKSAAIVLFLDVIKAVVPMLVVNYIWFGYIGGYFTEEMLVPALYIGIGVILGHNFPFFLKFKGGKGVACTLGLMLVFDWRIALIALGMCILAILIFRVMSVGSLIGYITVAIGTALLYSAVEIMVIIGIVVALGFFTHRSNIRLLIIGKERKINFRKNKPPEI